MITQILFDEQYLEIPESTRSSLTYYILEGQPPGGFLAAVLRNDLCDAAVRADLEHRRILALLAQWVFHRAPPDCHGGKEAVEGWITRRGLKGRK